MSSIRELYSDRKEIFSSIGFEFREDKYKGVATSCSVSIQFKHQAA